ncbi:MAG: Hsp20 family protein [Inquilinus sp.]|nr:Hsp20 family protein [Inquilinus sp.]
MTSFDLSPLFRSTVGFDRMSRLLDAATRADQRGQSYPPYDIEKVDENAYRITMAVAGFGEDDIELNQTENMLTVRGKIGKAGETGTFLYRGIAERSFEQRFQLADYIEVRGARLENGLLNIDLVREVPEALKPRTIRIESAEPRRIAGKKAA